jgi:cyclophilin family peptidyl-prolyl cis-trans isomerase
MRKRALMLSLAIVALSSFIFANLGAQGIQDDPVVQRILELGSVDNQAMKWADYATNRFGGRLTGSDAYENATHWAVWQFGQWGIEADLDEVGALPVGFNRGPWFGKMLEPKEKSLYFGTPSFTAGTRGVQRGPVTILRTDPFSVPGRNPTPEEVELKRQRVADAIAEVEADPSAFHGAWVLIGGENTGFGRDGRRSTPEYSDSELMPPLTRALVEAGALGTIQRAGLPLRILDGHVDRWEDLPELPDIKLLDIEYDEIRSLVEAGEPVELEFDIRNWFKMGPVEYHNVVAVIPGTDHPEEYVILGGHFDSFDGGTGGVDDGSGFSPGMEAMRLIAAAGARPKRSIAMILFAAEENGLVGSQSWLERNPDLHGRIVTMINRDGSPSAITGAAVPPLWEDDLRELTRPLEALNPRWPFSLEVNPYPSLRPVNPGGTDASAFAKVGIPTFRFITETDYSYQRAWHTLYDTYSELVPYAEHQEHSALVTAVVAYGIANLAEPLTREGSYLPDGLFADITTSSGARVIASLDFQRVPLQVAHFVRIVEGNAGAPQGGGFGRGSQGPSIGRIRGVDQGRVSGVLDSEVQRAMAYPELPLTPNPALGHDGPGVLGLSGSNEFYLTLQASPDLDDRYTALGRVVAGAHVLGEIGAGEEIRRIRILRSGETAMAFDVGDDAFQQILRREGPR